MIAVAAIGGALARFYFTDLGDALGVALRVQPQNGHGSPSI
ncbi:MAG: hypothetical protein O6923_03480 [Actinobacteria bacterium]|nr:hypothetical protein [Actinomycetota bacterium]